MEGYELLYAHMVQLDTSLLVLLSESLCQTPELKVATMSPRSMSAIYPECMQSQVCLAVQEPLTLHSAPVACQKNEH